jgi:hypothetical protein
MNASQKQ